ncbi:beta-1,4-galactosyltransferase 1-like isoform X2 [Oculina patagonica]
MEQSTNTPVGRLYVDQSVPKMEDIEKKMSNEFSGWVDRGGRWKPTECKARVKMALIIPYRNRYEQLSIFLRHMHPMLKRQNLDYRIFLIEQAGNTTFNRGMLLNIGYKEALKFDQYKCFIFHDVDLMPENDRNKYSCPSSPRHLSVAVDKFHYRLPYEEIFGGAGSFTREHFELINGFSNKFWGWGGEDDDLYKRIFAKGLQLTRPSIRLGRYKMIKKFHKTSKADPNRFDKLEDSIVRMDNDGLNSLNYTVEKLVEHRLYTLISVDVKEDKLEYRTTLTQQEGSASGIFPNISTQLANDNTRNGDELFTVNR